MSMPTGKEFEAGYATVTNIGMCYKDIAEIMTKEGHKMNHATARNYFLRAMMKLARPILSSIGEETGVTEDELINNPEFQAALIDIIDNLNQE